MSWIIDEPMLEAYIFETSQILETLEQLMLVNEKKGVFAEDSINEIFRFMHTIKGSSAMMMYDEISTLAHRMEDVFYIIREHNQVAYDFSELVDMVLESIDFFKIELMKIKNGEKPDGDNASLIKRISLYIDTIKVNNTLSIDSQEVVSAKENNQQYYISSNNNENSGKYYKAVIRFKADSEMENIRAYTVIHNITDLVDEVYYKPGDIIDDDHTIEEIRTNGFIVIMQSKMDSTKLKEYFEGIIFLESLQFEEIIQSEYKELSRLFQEKIVTEEIKIPKTSKKYVEKAIEKQETTSASQQNIISVNVEKLNKLMDMVGELVIAEAMVTQNPEVTCLEIDSFDKSSRQLHKITVELQDMVMAIRMVPLSATFMKMHRIVRDMSKKLDKNIALDIYGEETEIDKNIIEKISDPLMHIIRNSIDHGIEDEDKRRALGKHPQGTVVLEAKNSGSDVLIIVRDDGKGLDKKLLYEKAQLLGLVNRAFEDMNDRELCNLILHPGFSTKEQITEFSGRGVGMDVVTKNIESIGGSVIVDSELGKGTTIILKIPLTLAIIEGMNIKVGNSRFTIPIVCIKESFRASKKEIIRDNDGQEMIMVRGLCYPILRLHTFYKISTDITEYEEGILIMVEEDEKSFCFFADELLGQQQVVVKTLPNYIKRFKQIRGLGGCTLLGDGNISLILDVGEFELTNVNERQY